MSPSDSLDHPGSILYHSESLEVLFHKTVTGQELFMRFLTANCSSEKLKTKKQAVQKKLSFFVLDKE